MVDYYIDQEDVLTDFFRTYLTDPKARAEASNSNTLTATAYQKDFTVTPTIGSVSCITSLTVDGTTKTKWLDYFWDYQNKKVTFYSAMTGGESVVITFKEGTSNWIYSDKPDDNLTAGSFPRISLFTVGGSGNKIGGYQAKIDSRPVIQIDCWTRNGVTFTINSHKYSNEYLGRYLGNQALKSLQENESELFGIFFDYDVVSIPRGAGYSEEYMSHHTVIEIRAKGLDLGRINAFEAITIPGTFGNQVNDITEYGLKVIPSEKLSEMVIYRDTLCTGTHCKLYDSTATLLKTELFNGSGKAEITYAFQSGTTYFVGVSSDGGTYKRMEIAFSSQTGQTFSIPYGVRINAYATNWPIAYNIKSIELK